MTQMFLRFYWVVAIFFIPFLDAKVLIVTHSYNQPEFIEWQVASFKKFLKDDYEYVVFNDASDEKLKNKIEETCAQLQVPCYRIPQELHGELPLSACSERHCDGIQYSLDHSGFDHKGIVAIIDSDMFLIKPFSIENYLHGYEIAGPCLWGSYISWIHKKEAEYIGYLWPIIAFINMETLPNKNSLHFQNGVIDGFSLDTGAFSYYFFKENPEVNVRMMRKQFEINRTGYRYPFIFNLNEVPEFPKDTVLCKSILRKQPLKDWGAFYVNKEMLPYYVEHEHRDSALRLIVSGCEDIQFFENFTFLHYGRGSLYYGSESCHSHKAERIKQFLEEIGVL